MSISLGHTRMHNSSASSTPSGWQRPQMLANGESRDADKADEVRQATFLAFSVEEGGRRAASRATQLAQPPCHRRQSLLPWETSLAANFVKSATAATVVAAASRSFAAAGAAARLHWIQQARRHPCLRLEPGHGRTEIGRRGRKDRQRGLDYVFTRRQVSLRGVGSRQLQRQTHRRGRQLHRDQRQAAAALRAELRGQGNLLRRPRSHRTHACCRQTTAAAARRVFW